MRRRDEFLVGIFVTAALVVAAVGSLWLVRGGLAPGYALYAEFPWGAGVKPGQPVWIQGVTVGYIDQVELDPAGTVLIEMRINRRYRVPRGTTASLVANGLFGDQAINLQPLGPNPVSHETGDTLPTRPAAVGLQALTQRADTITSDIAAVLDAARSQLVDSAGLSDTRRALASLNQLAAQLTSIVAVQSRQLELTITSARSRISAVDSSEIDSVVRSLRTASDNLASATGKLDATVVRVNALLAKAENGNGSVGKFLNTPAVHDSLVTLLSRVNGILEDLKRNPRKYFSLSIF
jgi:phospholipid/cholesterol/gamma-HCH transport system substrate-binding protein